MTTTNHSDGARNPAAEQSQLLKTDALGRTRMSQAQREAILDAFEASGMSGQAFALQHGINIQTFASWMQKRRHARGDYHNESVCQKLRMRKATPDIHPPHSKTPPHLFNLIEVDLRKEPTTSKALEALEVLLPSGAIVRITHESQIGLLKTLIQQLSC
jgi:transposase-like protein